MVIYDVRQWLEPKDNKSVATLVAIRILIGSISSLYFYIMLIYLRQF